MCHSQRGQFLANDELGCDKMESKQTPLRPDGGSQICMFLVFFFSFGLNCTQGINFFFFFLKKSHRLFNEIDTN